MGPPNVAEPGVTYLPYPPLSTDLTTERHIHVTGYTESQSHVYKNCRMQKLAFNHYPSIRLPSSWICKFCLVTIQESDIKLMEKIQKRATKLVISLRKLPYKECLTSLNLHTLKYRRLRGDMIEVFFKLWMKFMMKKLHLQGSAKKQPLKFFTIFSAMVWNFNLKFYSFI